jgi:hypothetical protein
MFPAYVFQFLDEVIDGRMHHGLHNMLHLPGADLKVHWKKKGKKGASQFLRKHQTVQRTKLL